MLEGKAPASDVAYYPMDPFGVSGVKSDMIMVMPERNDFAPIFTEGKNSWGVPHQIDDFGTGFMPAPGQFILKDVTKWRDVVKAPYDYDYDWAAAAERDLTKITWDPETQVSSMFAVGGGYFLALASFLGFEGAMLAMYDEPEAVHELLDYICEYDLWAINNILSNYKTIDVVGFGDDNATEINPFISYDMFKEFLLPRYKRVADAIKEHGKIVSYHNCGRCEDFMDDFVEIGTQVWNCATDKNDLNAFKEKHGNKVIVEYTPRVLLDVPEEVVRQQVRDELDTFAQGGAFIYLVNSSTMNAEAGANVMKWLGDELDTYGKGFYTR